MLLRDGALQGGALGDPQQARATLRRATEELLTAAERSSRSD
ncbi:hypothetical protein [Micromonospora psammae]